MTLRRSSEPTPDELSSERGDQQDERQRQGGSGQDGQNGKPDCSWAQSRIVSANDTRGGDQAHLDQDVK